MSAPAATAGEGGAARALVVLAPPCVWAGARLRERAAGQARAG